MAALLTIPEIITLGDATVYLMGNDVAAGSLWGSRLNKTTTVVLIAYTTDALRWAYEMNPADSSLRKVGNYLVWLCGIYGAQARSFSGGGNIVPIPSVGTPARLDFYVDSTTPVKTGQSAVIFLAFIGYNLQFDRGNQPQATVSDGFSTYYSWDKTTGTFQCFGAANAGELFSLIPYV